MKKTILLSCIIFIFSTEFGRVIEAAGLGKELIAISSVAYEGGSNIANSVTTYGEGNIMVTGASDNKYLTIKYNKDLIKLKFKEYDGGINSDSANAVVADSLGNIIVAGNTTPFFYYYIIKYDINLELVLSSATYDAGLFAKATGVAVDSFDNIFVTGYSNDGGTYNFYSIKYDRNLNFILKKEYDSGKYDQAMGIGIDSKDNILITGKRGNGINMDFYTIKYDNDLNVVAFAVYDSGGEDEATGIAVDSSDNIIVTGKKKNGTEWDFFTIKYDSELNVINSSQFDSGDSDYPTGVAVDSDDNIIVCGNQLVGADWNYLVIKYDKSLNVLGSAVFDGGYIDLATSVAVDAEDNIIVTGQSSDGSTNNYYTIKYVGSPRITSVGKAYQGETGLVKVWGKSFIDGSVVSFENSAISLNTSIVYPQNMISTNITVSSFVPLGITTVTVTNSNGEFSTSGGLLEIKARKTVIQSENSEINAILTDGSVKIEIPAESFPQDALVTVSAIVSTVAYSGSFNLTPVSVIINTLPEVTLQKDITITMYYSNESVEGFNKNRFALAYYDESSAEWIPILTTLYTAENKVVGTTSMINRMFAVLELPSPVRNLAGVRVYPNPYKPGSGTDFDDTSSGEGVLFSNLTESFKFMIFNIAGELVFSKEDQADVYGRYLWDTKNEQGEKIASGVYIFLVQDVQDSSSYGKGKFSIIR